MSRPEVVARLTDFRGPHSRCYGRGVAEGGPAVPNYVPALPAFVTRIAARRRIVDEEWRTVEQIERRTKEIQDHCEAAREALASLSETLVGRSA